MEEKRVFDSWKEVAAYLRRSVKTCQRWESELGLPVHRPEEGARSHIFAYKDEIDRWLLKTQHLDDAGAPDGRPARRKRAVWTGAFSVLAVVLVITGMLIWRSFLKRTSPGQPAIKPSLAVLEFENALGDKDLENWTAALADLLAEDLRQSRAIHVVSTARVSRILADLRPAGLSPWDPRALTELAEKAAVGLFVRGAVYRANEGLFIRLMVANPHTGEVVKSLSAECARESDVFDAVDELTVKVKRAVGLSAWQAAKDADKKIGEITTDSPVAFALYSRGDRAGATGQYETAVACLERAVAVDGDFALAHYRLSQVHEGRARPAEARNCLRRAFALARRLPEKKRWLVQAACEMDQAGAREVGLAACRRVVDADSYDYDAVTMLARLYAQREEWDKAVPLLERLVEKNRDDASVHLELADGYAAVGSPGRAERLLVEHARAFPATQAAVNRAAALYAIIQKRFDTAKDCLDRAFAGDRDDPANALAGGWLHFYRGELAEAEKEFLACIDLSRAEDQLPARRALAALCLLQGRLAEARRQAELAAGLARTLEDAEAQGRLGAFIARLCRVRGDLAEADRELAEALRHDGKGGLSVWALQALHDRALIALEMDRSKEFTDLSEKLAQLVDQTGSARLRRICLHLQAQRDLANNDQAAAMSHIVKAVDLVPAQCAATVDEDQVQYWHTLAEAQARERFPIQATETFEKVGLLTLGRAYQGDIFALSLYLMAKNDDRLRTQLVGIGAEEQIRRRRAEAIDSYRKFLDLWKLADPVFPEVEDARARLQVLQVEQAPPPPVPSLALLPDFPTGRRAPRRATSVRQDASKYDILLRIC